MKLRPFMITYGGGHAAIMAALWEELSRRGDDPTVLGLTTAYSSLRRAGCPAVSVETLVRPDEDLNFLELSDQVNKEVSHPDISPAQTRAYFGLGIRDLVAEIGFNAAVKEVEKQGRKAFLPIEVLRRHFREIRPDIVITTNSPRYELAALHAANAEGIPTLAINDLFPSIELSWMKPDNYAEHVAVLSQEVADILIKHGFEHHRVRVTGNPAFDKLEIIGNDPARRRALRDKLGLTGKTVILFPAAGAEKSKVGRAFLNIETAIAQLEHFCLGKVGFSYLVRQHPNRPLSVKTPMTQGTLDDGKLLSPEDAIMVSDIVCVENSTLGLQAALARKPTICIGFADQVRYPHFGLASAVENLDQAFSLIDAGLIKLEAQLTMPALGSAAKNIVKLIDEIMFMKKYSDPN